MDSWSLQIQSFLIVLVMVIGIIVRRNRKLHVRMMSFAMAWDIILILQIELNRSAIMKASKAVTNPLILNTHVGIAVTTVLLYGAMVYTGRALLAGRNEIRQRHRFLGYSTLFMRVLTLITSFWAVVPKE